MTENRGDRLRCIPFLTFSAAVLLAGLGGASVRTLTRPAAAHTPHREDYKILVTHVVFNHVWDPPNQGPNPTQDALSMRYDISGELEHGPRIRPSDFYGGGEWIVEKENENLGYRNEPSLYLRDTKQVLLDLYARFEATPNLEEADISFPPPAGWHGSNRVTVKFHTASSELDRFEVLTKVSVPQGVVKSSAGTQEYVKFTRTGGAMPDVVDRIQTVFEWQLHRVKTDKGEVLFDPPKKINRSGLATPTQFNDVVLTPAEEALPEPARTDLLIERAKGHPFYVVLDTPTTPWYKDLKSQPWEKALLEVTKPAAAKGAGTLLAAGSKLATFVHTGGHAYDVGTATERAGAQSFTNSDWNKADVVTHTRIKLLHFIIKQGKKKNLGNCHDFAAGLVCYMNLVGCNSTGTHLSPFGYINTVSLIGQGLCNAPFFGNQVDGNIWGYITVPKVVPEGDFLHIRRLPFGHHTFVTFAGVIFDATVGPETGTRAEAAYRLAVIDDNDPEEKVFGKTVWSNHKAPSTAYTLEIVR